MPPPTAPGAHDAGIDYGENAADIAADNMAAHIAAEGDKEMAPALSRLPTPDVDLQAQHRHAATGMLNSSPRDPVLHAAADDAMSFSASEEDGAVYEPVERAEPTPQSPSAGPADFDELCMKVIKAGDMTSVIDDKVRDEVRFEVAVAFVYARENPHITGPGRPRANNKDTTVQALWRQTAVQCGFSEKEKPEPQGSKLSKVTKYARTILTEKWDTIEKPDFKAWRAKEFMSHIECLENLIDGFNPHAYTPEVVSVLRRLAEKCRDASDRAVESRESQGLLPRGDAVVAASAVTPAMAAEVVRAHARSSDPRSQGKRQCLEAAECAGASEPSSSMGAPRRHGRWCHWRVWCHWRWC